MTTPSANPRLVAAVERTLVRYVAALAGGVPSSPTADVEETLPPLLALAIALTADDHARGLLGVDVWLRPATTQALVAALWRRGASEGGWLAAAHAVCATVRPPTPGTGAALATVHAIATQLDAVAHRRTGAALTFAAASIRQHSARRPTTGLLTELLLALLDAPTPAPLGPPSRGVTHAIRALGPATVTPVDGP